jgi:4'-phosphopantetheinyl transferase
MSIWSYPSEKPRFSDSEIHVWRLVIPPEQVPDEILIAVLSPEEQSKAARFVIVADRRRFIQAHSMLRAILGMYLECRPEDITYQFNAYGKPALAHPALGDSVHFNISHAMDIVLVAVSRSNDVGVDVEFRRPMHDMHALIQCNFSQTERRFFEKLPTARLESEFFIHWTLKEAYIKGIGLGLSCSLRTFSVKPDRSRPDLGRFYTVVPEIGPRWHCQLLPLARGYVGAVAASSISSDTKLYNYIR